MTFHWCPHTGHSMLEARYVVYWETSEAWPNCCACCACCNLVWHAFSMLLFPPWGLLVVLQHGAFGSTHYLQLFRVFLKIIFFLKTLPGGPTYTLVSEIEPLEEIFGFRFLFEGVGNNLNLPKYQGGLDIPSFCIPSLVWRGWKRVPPPPPLWTVSCTVDLTTRSFLRNMDFTW